MRDAFGEALAVIWKVTTGILGIGILASLMMRDIPMHRYVDEKWGMTEGKQGSDSEAVELKGGDSSVMVLPKDTNSSHVA